MNDNMICRFKDRLHRVLREMMSLRILIALAATVVYLSSSCGAVLAKQTISPDRANDPDILGLRYLQGDGVKKDTHKAYTYFSKAAIAGQAAGQMHLAQMLERGEGVRKNPKRAFGLMKQAAEQGLSEAQNHLGWMYEKGIGTNKDAKNAVRWFRRAAEKGSAAAKYNLGVSYQKGHGVKLDSARAMQLFRDAAQRGNANAQFMLGVFYTLGIGVDQDFAEGHKWFETAKCPTRWNEVRETAQRWKNTEASLRGLSLERTAQWFEYNASKNSRFIRERLYDWMP